MMGRQTTYSNKKGTSKSLLALGLYACLAIPSAAFGFTFLVDSPGDGTDGNPGDGICDGSNGCTLRAAIQEANAYPGADIINLNGYSVTLTTPGVHENAGAEGDLDITDDLTIEGNSGSGRNIINGSTLDRVFHVLGGATVTMSGIEITGGEIDANSTPNDGQVDGGAGVYVQSGHLTLKNVAISRNRLYASNATFQTAGGGLYVGEAAIVLMSEESVIFDNRAPRGGGASNLGTLTIWDTTIVNNEAKGGLGGGIANQGGYLNVSSIVLERNEASQGAAIFNSGLGVNQGNVIITNTNITANAASQFGGGIYNLGPMTIINSSINLNTSNWDGGGVYNLGLGNIDIINTTISSNEGRSGGGIYNTRQITLTSSTVYNNQACSNCGSDSDEGAVGGNEIAIFSSSVASRPGLTLANTIIADGWKSDGLTTACTGSAGYESLISSDGYNLEDGNSCGLTSASDLTNVANIQLDDTLEIDAAFPATTPVHALLAGSPAINSGGNNCPDVDQRFLQRNVVGTGACDIGAYEFDANTSLNPDLVDLKLTIQDTPDPARPNDPQNLLTYTFTITNLYLKAANGVSLDIQLPVSFSFANVKTITSGSLVSCDRLPNAQNLIECGISSLEPLGRVDISVSGVPTIDDSIITASGVIIFANEVFPQNNSAVEHTEISRRGSGGVTNFNGSGAGGGSLHPLFLLLMGGLLFGRIKRS